jgi:hypothetical protein
MSNPFDFQKNTAIERKMVARMISTSLQRDFVAPCSAARRAARDRFKLIEVIGGNTLYGRSAQSWRQSHGIVNSFVP